MQVVSLCPLRTGSMLWQVKRGTWALTVVCKATFTLLPGESRLASEQEPTNEEDEYWNDDPARSLHAPSDLVPFKPRADVLLVGSAFAPRGEPVRSLAVHLGVADIEKGLEVVCDRVWTQERLLAEGGRFTKMPLRWERAAGGPETPNPIGVRVRDALPDIYGQIQLPNLQPAGLLVSDPSDSIEPIGFGPIAPNWPGRTQRLGRHASLWARARRPMEPVPNDLDAAFFNSAPADQQTEFIRDNERIILQNLHPEHPQFVTNLPGVHPVAFLERGDVVEELELTADTLWIDTDRAVCTVTWRGRVDAPPQSGRVLVAMEGPGERVAWSDIERLARRTGEFTDSSTVDLPEFVNTGQTPARSTRSSPPNKIAKERRPQLAVNGPDPRDAAPPPISARAPLRNPTHGDTFHGHEVEDEPQFASDTVAADPPRPAPRSVLPFSSSTAASSAVFRSPAVPSNKSRPPPLDLGSTVINEGPARDSAPNWLAEPTHAEGRNVAPPPERGPSWLSGPVSSGSPGAPASFVGPAPQAPSSFVAPPAQNPPSVFPPAPATSASSESPWAGASSVGPKTLLGAQAHAASSSTTASRPPPYEAASPRVTQPMNAQPSSIDTSSAAMSGVVAASNAAAAAQPWSSPAEVPRAPAVAAPSDKRPISMGIEAVDLVWFDKESVPRLRSFWPELVVELGFDPSDPRHDLGGDDKGAARDRHDAFGVLAEAPAFDGPAVSRAMLDAVNERGRFTPPLVVTFGELVFPFDELEQLKATTSAISPLIGDNKRLKDGVDAVNELLASGCLMSSSSVVERLGQQLKDLFKESGKSSHTGYLEMHVERVLLEARHYQRRELFGDTFIRALLAVPGAEASIPVYLPDALSKRLPVMSRFRARVVAELTAQQDQYEAHPYALRVVALGRILPLDGRRRR